MGLPPEFSSALAKARGTPDKAKAVSLNPMPDVAPDLADVLQKGVSKFKTGRGRAESFLVGPNAYGPKSFLGM